MIRTAARLTAAVAPLLAAPTTSGARTTTVPEFDPDLKQPTPLVLQGRTWTLEGPTYTIQLRRLDDTERQNFIGQVTGLKIDPFVAPPGQPPRFFSFLLRIENRGEVPLQFNPIHSWLMTNRKKIESPLGLTDLSFSYHIVGREFPPAYERVGPALLQRPRAIGPGETLSGLLVYHVVEPKTKRFHVDVELTLPSGDVVTFAAPYRKRKTGTR